MHYVGIGLEELRKTLVSRVGAPVKTVTGYSAVLYLLHESFNDALSMDEVTKREIRNGRMILNGERCCGLF
jgi:methyltransferase-like protein